MALTIIEAANLGSPWAQRVLRGMSAEQWDRVAAADLKLSDPWLRRITGTVDQDDPWVQHAAMVALDGDF